MTAQGNSTASTIDCSPRCLDHESRSKVIKHFSCSTQLRRKCILLLTVKMPTIVDILIFISIINTTSDRLKAINFFICRVF